MPKNRNKNKKAASAGNSKGPSKRRDHVIEKYDMEQSQQRLLREGFHPAVTSKTPEQVEKAWLARVDRLIDRPTRDEFVGQMGPSSQSSYTRCLTTAMLLMRHESKYAHPVKKTARPGQDLLATMLSTVDIGGEIANAIFQQGRRSVFNAAITSLATWHAVAHCAKTWDFNASDERTFGSSGVMMAVAPECTIGELNMANDLDPYGMDSSNILSSWYKEAMDFEREIYLSIYLIHGRLAGTLRRGKASQQKRQGHKIIPVEFMSDEIVSVVKKIQETRYLWGSSQFISSPQGQLFEPPVMFSANRLRRMLKYISGQRTALQVLYFERIPLLDRRMMAVILRGCPNVRMIGIYDCPLIHFGDVLCLLDLIHEVNCKRREAGLPEIKGFDFYPRYNHGTPFQSASSATYGLTWGPHKLDVVQRGFFDVILKAFMKTKKMNLDLLFDKDEAFCEYLGRVPLPPLAVPTFLDALHRYMEVKDGGPKREVIYDLVKPVRLGLDRHMDRDWQNGYMLTLAQNLVFCSSCGYETLEEFYSAAARETQPHRRVCAGCTLQRWLDEEDDHLKSYKKQALDTLYPKWKGLGFNHDAPMPRAAKAIIKLRCTTSERPDTNHTTVDGEGAMYTRQVMLDLLRDNKVHWDSLADLPTLSELLDDGKTWGHFYNKCNNLDVYCRAVRCAAEQGEGGEEGNSLRRSRFDGGVPDTAEELQPSSSLVRGVPCHDIASAVMFHAGLTAKGWGAREKPAGNLGNLGVVNGANFW
ncbi:uncharacterized protein MAM_05303 [Metarhizium album ARSEF 1941]|uniref:Ribosomal protein L36 n=1 Tax=Metarhizium album (strain ARSEF 1941) TaxID=1081103 RepID=A0A0B2WTH0_METAS|nr:uncharacterized protein MAM_05303 [Metarhizium album ARSEF 1941]KHN96747.1 hypothetical protein MAM_05303 [Metarhizium album ARSEF 1941]